MLWRCNMKTEDFDYELPKELIAQTPIKNRSESKLLVMDKNTGDLEDKIFKDVTSYLKKGDVLVLNNTRVIPARIIGEKESTGAVIELLLLKDLGMIYLIFCIRLHYELLPSLKYRF